MAMTDLEQTAMERLRLASQMSLKLYKQPLLLTDSGGKDSAVICKLAENAGIPFEIVHSHTTADAPETVYHVRKRAKEYEAKGVEYTIRLPTYQRSSFRRCELHDTAALYLKKRQAKDDLSLQVSGGQNLSKERQRAGHWKCWLPTGGKA